MNRNATAGIAALVFVAYGAAIWKLGALLGLSGSGLWALRAALSVVGCLAAGLAVWLLRKRGGRGAAAAGGRQEDEILVALRAAQERLRSSRLAEGGSLGTLPVVLVLGPQGSAKTTSVMHSGLEPELLAGEVYRGDAIAPTRAVNVWYAGRSVFVEAGGGIGADAGRWTRLVRRLRPRRVGAALSGTSQAPRLAVVCFSCEEFAKADRATILAGAARDLRANLVETSQLFGIRLPVYVIFTKADRIPHFGEYVRNLTRDEVREVVGATLPLDTGDVGLYADRASHRLEAELHRLFRSLAERRLEFLARETVVEASAGAYEFPRELRKLTPAAVQFLVDLCKPSQLQVSPVLRGFYFTGVRPLIVSDAAMAAPVAAPLGRTPSAGATRVFSPGQDLLEAPVAVRAAPVSRKVPQWVFLERLFRDVVLTDRVAFGVTRGGARVDAMRRGLIAAAAILALVLAVGFSVSFLENRDLEAAVRGSVGRLAATPPLAPDRLATGESLKGLEELRRHLVTLRGHERDGAPAGLRWGLPAPGRGLYVGPAILPDVHRAYFGGFRTLMYDTTHTALLASLRSLPENPTETSEYALTYDRLKAYLVITLHPEKSTAAFLSPVLMREWHGPRRLDSPRAELARTQFDFFAEELLLAKPYDDRADSATVARTRAFLLQFGGTDRIYQFMLSEAAKAAESVQYNRQFPGSNAVVVNGYEVPGPFTPPGWKFMERAFKNADRFFGGEEWVLGKTSVTPPAERAKLVAELRARYRRDYVRHWKRYLDAASVVDFASAADGTQKLGRLSGNQSPLLAMFWLAARHTAVDSNGVAEALQPVHLLTPAALENIYINPANQEYVSALVTLQASLERFVKARASRDDAGAESAADQTMDDASSARVVTRQLAQGFRADSTGATVQRLLLEPIDNVEPFVRNFGRQVAAKEQNGAGQRLCKDFNALMAKFPFSPDARTEATFAEIADMFQPQTGQIWDTFDETFSKVIVREGRRFAPRSGINVTVSTGFLAFLNRVTALSELFFPEGRRAPHIVFSMTPILSPGIGNVSVNTRVFTPPFTQPRPFVWPSAEQRATITAQIGGQSVTLNSQQGPWAAFRLFHNVDRWVSEGPADGSRHVVEWAVKSGGQPSTLPDGTPLKLAFRLDMGGNPPVFREGYFSGLKCPATVVR